MRNPYPTSVNGWCALLRSRAFNERSVVEVLLEAGANPMRTMRGGTHKGQTALEIAEKRYEGVDRKGFTTDHWARAILEKGKERWRMAKGELR